MITMRSFFYLLCLAGSLKAIAMEELPYPGIEFMEITDFKPPVPTTLNSKRTAEVGLLKHVIDMNQSAKSDDEIAAQEVKPAVPYSSQPSIYMLTKKDVLKSIKCLYTANEGKNFHEICVDIFEFHRDFRNDLLTALFRKQKNPKFIADVNTVTFDEGEILDHRKNVSNQMSSLVNGSKLLHVLAHQALESKFKELVCICGVDWGVTNGQSETVEDYAQRIGRKKFSNVLKQIQLVHNSYSEVDDSDYATDVSSDNHTVVPKVSVSRAGVGTSKFDREVNNILLAPGVAQKAPRWLNRLAEDDWYESESDSENELVEDEKSEVFTLNRPQAKKTLPLLRKVLMASDTAQKENTSGEDESWESESSSSDYEPSDAESDNDSIRFTIKKPSTQKTKKLRKVFRPKPKVEQALDDEYKSKKKVHKKRDSSLSSVSQMEARIRDLYSERESYNFHRICIAILGFHKDIRRKLFNNLFGRSGNERFIKDVNTVSFDQGEVAEVYKKARKDQAPPLESGSKLLHVLVHQALRGPFNNLIKKNGVDLNVTNSQGETVWQYANKIGCPNYANAAMYLLESHIY